MLNLFIAFVFIVGAGVSAWGLWLARSGINDNSYIDSREADATHLLMNATMAIMLTSLYSVQSARVITVLYWLCAAALAVRILMLFRQNGARNSARGQAHIGGSIYHLCMIFTMLYALRLMPPETGPSMMAMPGMAPTSNMAPSSAPGWPAMVLGVVFLLDAASSSVMVVFFPQSLQKAQSPLAASQTYDEAPPRSAHSSVALLRLSLAPHLLMDLGMAYMLLSG